MWRNTGSLLGTLSRVLFFNQSVNKDSTCYQWVWNATVRKFVKHQRERASPFLFAFLCSSTIVGRFQASYTPPPARLTLTEGRILASVLNMTFSTTTSLSFNTSTYSLRYLTWVRITTIHHRAVSFILHCLRLCSIYLVSPPWEMKYPIQSNGKSCVWPFEQWFTFSLYRTQIIVKYVTDSHY